MEFPGNSQNVTGEKKKPALTDEKKREVIEKVISGEVVQRKKTILRRFKETFLGGDGKSVVRYISAEVLLPAMKNLFVDAVDQGAKRMVYGDTAPRRRIDVSGGPRVSYNRPVERYSRHGAMLPDQPPRGAPPAGRRQDVNDVILVSRDEAELVLERLQDIIDKYDVASVADFYDLVGLPTNYIDNKWGWSNLHYVDIRQVREGYLIALPSVEPI